MQERRGRGKGTRRTERNGQKLAVVCMVQGLFLLKKFLVPTTKGVVSEAVLDYQRLLGWGTNGGKSISHAGVKSNPMAARIRTFAGPHF